MDEKNDALEFGKKFSYYNIDQVQKLIRVRIERLRLKHRNRSSAF